MHPLWTIWGNRLKCRGKRPEYKQSAWHCGFSSYSLQDGDDNRRSADCRNRPAVDGIFQLCTGMICFSTFTDFAVEVFFFIEKIDLDFHGVQSE